MSPYPPAAPTQTGPPPSIVRMVPHQVIPAQTGSDLTMMLVLGGVLVITGILIVLGVLLLKGRK